MRLLVRIAFGLAVCVIAYLFTSAWTSHITQEPPADPCDRWVCSGR